VGTFSPTSWEKTVPCWRQDLCNICVSVWDFRAPKSSFRRASVARRFQWSCFHVATRLINVSLRRATNTYGKVAQVPQVSLRLWDGIMNVYFPTCAVRARRYSDSEKMNLAIMMKLTCSELPSLYWTPNMAFGMPAVCLYVWIVKWQRSYRRSLDW
jgi:hypothetical protein